LGEGEFADLCADAAQAVEAGGGEIFGEAEFLEQSWFGCSDIGWWGVAVEITEEGEQAAHERRVGIAAEMTSAVAPFTHDPGEGDAAFDAVGFGALGFRERGTLAHAIDHGSEALLRVLDEGKVVDHLLLFFGQGHAAKRAGSGVAVKFPIALADGLSVFSVYSVVILRFVSSAHWADPKVDMGWSGGR
jgi:hypothetical protein